MADAKLRTFTDADLAALRGLIEREKARKPPPGPPKPPADDHGLPRETYVALTPAAGIPGLDESEDTGTVLGTGDEPGSAECKVFRLLDGQLYPAGIPGETVLVYNLSETAVPGKKWVLAHRDKFGEWYLGAEPIAEASAGGGGGVPPGTFSGAKVYVGTPISYPVPDGTGFGAVPWDAVEWDTDGYYGGGNPTRLTAPATGKYLVNVQVYFNLDNYDVQYYLLTYVDINGTGVIVGEANSSSSLSTSAEFAALTICPVSNFSFTIALSAGDYLQVVPLLIRQNVLVASTYVLGTKDVPAADYSYFSMTRLG